MSPSDRRRGLFVTLEGGEGSGKSYQLEALAQRIEVQGISVVRTREPGGTPLGERLRGVLLDVSEDGVAIDPMTEALLFVAARAELVAAVIAPALQRGNAVVCDRFGDSTLAYQGFGRALDLPTLEGLNAIVTRNLVPDLTVLLDLPVEEGLQRNAVDGKRDRFEREEAAFHERVRRGYHSLARREPERWIVVDARQPREAVTDSIWRRLEPLVTSRRTA